MSAYIRFAILPCPSLKPLDRRNESAEPKDRMKTKAVKASKLIKATSRIMIGIVTGARGTLARRFTVAIQGKTPASVTITQTDCGLAPKDALPCRVTDGKLDPESGKRLAGVQCGAYVAHGGERGAKANLRLVTGAQYMAEAKPGVAAWAVDKAPFGCLYIGNPDRKEIIAVAHRGGIWQIEQDSNANNAHERGYVRPLSVLDPKEDKALIAKCRADIEATRKMLAAIR